MPKHCIIWNVHYINISHDHLVKRGGNMTTLIELIKGIFNYIIAEFLFYAVLSGLIWIWIWIEPTVLGWFAS